MAVTALLSSMFIVYRILVEGVALLSEESPPYTLNDGMEGRMLMASSEQHTGTTGK